MSCHALFKQSKTGSTITLKRHQNYCMKHAKKEKGHEQIALDFISKEEKAITISNFKYDKEKVKRVLSKLIIVDEKSFCLVESQLFNLYSKALQPRHKNWLGHSIKRECMTIYAKGKENLKEELKGVNLVCLTTEACTSRKTKV